MEKVKILGYSGGMMTADVTIRDGEKTTEFHGHPHVVVFNDYVQVGCIRITKDAIRTLSNLSKAMGNIEETATERGVLFQQGDYATNDPNTRSV